MRNAWILTCRLMPKNCQTWRLWYLYLDGTMFKYGGPVPMFQAQELGQIRSTRTLSHERTMNLMRFGSVVIKSADLSRALETITMPLGMWLKDLLVNKRASLEDFRNWRCLLVTLYCSCCTANCKEKNNTYNIPEEKKKSEREGHWNIFHDSFLIHVQMVSVDISNMLSILLCASFSVFF